MSDDDGKGGTGKGGTGKGGRERSPSFPFIPLKVAVDRLVVFEDHYKRGPALAEAVGSVWGMKVGSGNVAQTLSALKAFGLLETRRTASGTEVVISEDGRTYLRAQQENVRQDILQRIALRPKQIQSHWERWGTGRPKDAACLDELVLKEGFTPDGAAIFLRVYDATIAYAGLAEADKTEGAPMGRRDYDDEQSPENGVLRDVQKPPAAAIAKIGDYIQWTSAGVDQFSRPGRVTWVSEDNTHLRVHGSMTGIPMSDVSIVDAPKVPPTSHVERAPNAREGGDLNVLLTGRRLQITADVDLVGLERLKEMLGHYEKILQLLQPN